MTTQSWMMPFLEGKCFDFALALALQVESAEFVSLGSDCEAMTPDHVGLKIGDYYADVRGLLSEEEFVAHIGGPAFPVDRSLVEFFCGLSGVPAPYKGSSDIAFAKKAVARAFPNGVQAAIEELEPAAFGR